MAKQGSAAPAAAGKTEPKKKGRPSIFTKALGTTICRRLAEGETLRAICREDEMPTISTVMAWVLDLEKHKEFSEQYTRAREAQAENMFDEILEISDDSSDDHMMIEVGKKDLIVENKEFVQRSRLRVDTRKWYLSKVLPKKFGEKLDLTSAGKVIKGNTIVLQEFNGAKGK